MALAAALAAQLAATGAVYARELVLGWILALTQGGIALWIDARAMAGNPNRFMLWAVVAQNLRLMAVLAVLAWPYQRGMPNFEPFLAAALAGVVVMLAGQVWAIHVRSMRVWTGRMQDHGG